MVSSSKDGEIISRAANAVGVETVRGSKTRGGVKASLELIKKIQKIVQKCIDTSIFARYNRDNL